MGNRPNLDYSADEIVEILEQRIHNLLDRRVMIAYLTNYPDSMERLAWMCDVSLSTVKRIINRNSFIYKYFK